MAKTVDQILFDRRMENQRQLDNRILEVYKKSPRLKEIDKEIKILNLKRIEYKLRDQDDSPLARKIDGLKEEKRTVLRKLAIDEDYLKLHYTCDKCKDTGVYKGKSCSCRKQLMSQKLYDQSMIYDRISKENFSNFEINRFRKSKQANESVSPYENMRQILVDVRRYLDNYRKGSPNLYFYGKVGTGKTFMINCIAKELMDKGVPVLYQSSVELLEFLNDYQFMFVQEKSNYKSKYELIFDVEVLIIDDLGSENTNEQSKSSLFEVINKRLVANKTTIISSNENAYDLGNKYGTRISSRIMGEYEPFLFYGSDLRIN